MKLVFLSPAAQMGGAEAVLLEMLRALREARPLWSLHVIVAEEGLFQRKASAMGFPCETLPFPARVKGIGEDRHAPPGSRTVRYRAKIRRVAAWIGAGVGAALYVRRLGRRLRELRPDIVHSNGMKMHFLGALARPGTGSLVWHLHDYLSARRTMLPLLRSLAKRCALIIANSESVADDARRALAGGPAVYAVHNSVDPEIFTPDGLRMDLDAAAGLPTAAPGTVRVGLVATFALWKGHEVFLRAAALVSGQFSGPVRFYTVGGPVYATAGSQRTVEELRALAAELGLGEQVGFTGFVEDAPGAMRALDIVVHASTEPEPFGLVIVQAMASARAVVVSAAGGACELAVAETDALTHRPGDVDGLAAAIVRLAADPGLRTRLGEAGRAKVRRDFTRARLAETVARLYEQVTAPCS